MDWDDDTELTPLPPNTSEQAAFDETIPPITQSTPSMFDDTELVMADELPAAETAVAPLPPTPKAEPAPAPPRRRAAVYSVVKPPGT